MSTYYFFYAEVRIKDKWYGMNPIVKHFLKDEYLPIPIVQGQSWYYEAYLKLRNSESAVGGMPNDLSEQVRKAVKFIFEESDNPTEEYIMKYMQDGAFSVSYYDGVKRHLKRESDYMFHGYVSKRTIAEYEADTADIDEWFTEAEYKELDPEMQMQYTYYEWNDDGGWYSAFKEIEHCVDCLIKWAQEGKFSFRYKDEEMSYSDMHITADKVRLIVYRD